MPHTDQKTILLVEDEALIAMMEKKQHESEGYRVVHAATGENALEITSSGKETIHLILMDIDLGKGLDGTEVAQEILKDHDIPILFLSSHMEKEIVNRTEKITNYGYVVKNSTFTVLDASIKMAFKLFDAMKSVQNKSLEVEAAYEKMQASNLELQTTQKQLQLYESMILNLNISISLYEVIYDEKNKPVDYRFLIVNPEFEKSVGVKAADLIGKRFLEIFPQTESAWLDVFSNVSLTGVPDKIEHYSIELNKYYEVFAFSPQKGQLAFLATDISDRKKSEEALMESSNKIKLVNKNLVEIKNELVESELRYKSLFQNLYNSFSLYEVIFDKKGKPVDYRILTVNPAYEKTVGVKASSVIGKTLLQLFPRTEPIWLEIIERVVLTGKPELIEHYAVEVDKYIEQLVYIPQKGQMAFIATDVTDRKKAEKEVLKSQLLLKSSLESPKDMIIMSIDKDYKYLFFNETHKIAMKSIYSKDVEVGMNVLECITSEDDWKKAKHNYDLAMSGKSHSTIEQYGIEKLIYYESFFNPILDEKDEIVGIVAFARDITERKESEEKIKNLLLEKDIILKEVHHRVKNNMSTIGALLQLQSDSHETPETKLVFQDAALRLNSMRVLYDKLYDSDTFGKLSLQDYIPSLVDEIINIFPQTVKIETQVEDIIIDVKLLSPLGIILNEMITNSMKYAFNTIERGLITIEARSNNRAVTVIYSDNGVGLPESITLETSNGLGLKLISMLIEQIDGSITIDRGRGTKYIIQFNF